MKLHENKKTFREAVRATSDFKEIREVYIEKDYWVTYALKTIFSDPIGKDTIFKGGTALSKCFNIIERFSEDIDLVVVRRDGDSDSVLKNKIRNVSKALESVLPEVKVKSITRKRGKNRKTAHTYSKEFRGEFGQVRDIIIVEASWFGSSEPNVNHRLSTYIYEMMKAKGQSDFADKYDLHPFDIKVLAVQRTLCEKIMSLIRFSHTKDPLTDLTNKIRHAYDLHFMLRNDEIRTFFESPDFGILLKEVALDDAANFKINIEWLAIHPAEAIIFKDVDRVWETLKRTYEQDFQYLVFGELPKHQDIHASLSTIKLRLTDLDWDLKPGQM